MSGFNWHPGAVGPPYDQFLDEIVKGLMDGSIGVTQIDTTVSAIGSREIRVEFVDLRPGFAAPVNFFQAPPSFSFAAVGNLAPKKAAGIGDLGQGKEPIVGFRDFELEPTDEGFVLLSRNGAVWWPRQKLRAHCSPSSYNSDSYFAAHDAPKADCSCGIYAYSHPNDPHLKATDVVWGEIALWGDVLICESGYRAEFAYPLSLFLKDTGTKYVRYMRDALEDNYGVPVFLVEERLGKTAAEVMGEIVSGLLLDRELEKGE